MFGGMEPKEEDVDATVGFACHGVVMLSAIAARPHLSPGEEVLFEGGDDLGCDLLSDLTLIRHWLVSCFRGT